MLLWWHEGFISCFRLCGGGELALKGCVLQHSLLPKGQTGGHFIFSCAPWLLLFLLGLPFLGQVVASLQNRTGFTHRGCAAAQMLPGCSTCTLLQQWEQPKIPISRGAFHSLKAISVVLGVFKLLSG